MTGLQLQFLPAILNWTAQLSDATGNPASGRLDTTRVAVAGHSRGGKLAALHYAHGEHLSTLLNTDCSLRET